MSVIEKYKWYPFKNAPTNGISFLVYRPPIFKNTETLIYVGWKGIARYEPDNKGGVYLRYESFSVYGGEPTHYALLLDDPE